MADKSNLWDFKGTKFTDWLIALPVSLILVMISGVIFQLYSRIGSLTSGATFLAIILCFLIVTVLKERREKGSSGLQKITVGVIIFLVVLDVIMLIVFFVNPPPMGKQAIGLAEIEDEYYSLSLYYTQDTQKMEQITQQMGQNLGEGKYDEALQNVEDYDKLKTVLVDKMVALCVKAENKSVNLESNKNLQELSIICKNKDSLIQCKQEDISAQKNLIDLFRNIKTKSKSDCLTVLDQIKGSEICNQMNKELNQESEEDWSSMEELCAKLP